jgi:hypothetical protein
LHCRAVLVYTSGPWAKDRTARGADPGANPSPKTRAIGDRPHHANGARHRGFWLSLIRAPGQDVIPGDTATTRHGCVNMSLPRPTIARRRQDKNRKQQERLKRKQVQCPFGVQAGMAEWDGIEKMSAVLQKFVEPDMEMATDEQGYRTVLTLGMVAWNAALLPEDLRISGLDDSFRKHRVRGARQELLRGILQELINRKQAFFSTSRRSIVDFVLTNTGDGYYLNVVSMLLTPPAP